MISYINKSHHQLHEQTFNHITKVNMNWGLIKLKHIQNAEADTSDIYTHFFIHSWSHWVTVKNQLG